MNRRRRIRNKRVSVSQAVEVEIFWLAIMAFVNTLSCECEKSELDLFTVPLIQTSIEELSIVEYLLVSRAQYRDSIDIDILGTCNQYIERWNIQLYICTKVDSEANSNTALVADTTAAPVNQLLHMFSHVDILLNGTLIFTNTYPYSNVGCCSLTVKTPRNRS